MLQQAPTHQFQPIERIDQRLALCLVIREWAYTQLLRGDGEVEELTGRGGGGESEGDGGGEGGDEGAGETVGSGFGGVGLDEGRDEGVDGLFGRDIR